MAQKTVKLKIKLAPAPVAPADPDLGTRTGNRTDLDWFDTPEIEYSLRTDHQQNDGAYLEEIDLSRSEYIALKATLARLRGFTVDEKAAAA